MFKLSSIYHQLNILIFRATDYNVGKNKLFGKRKFFLHNDEAFQFIDKVIVLDLLSCKKQSEFFGLAPGDVLNESINSI
jgi:hypothetical protein